MGDRFPRWVHYPHEILLESGSVLPANLTIHQGRALLGIDGSHQETALGVDLRFEA